MKRWVSLCLLAIFVCVPIVYSPKQEELIRSMAALEEGYYSIYVFWDGSNTDARSVTYPFMDGINQNDMKEWVNKSRLTFVSMNDEKSKYKYGRILDIENTPTYIVLDHRRIVLETTDPKAILSYFIGKTGT